MISPRLAIAATVLTVAIAVPSIVAAQASSTPVHHGAHSAAAAHAH